MNMTIQWTSTRKTSTRNTQPARCLPRWIAPAVLAAALGFGVTAMPAPAQAQDNLTRVLVDIADVVFRSGTPYYRYGDYGYNDRLVAGRDRYGRPVYYRVMPRGYSNDGRNDYGRVGQRNGPPYGNAYGYYRNGPGSDDFWCRTHRDCRYGDSRHNRYRGDRGNDQGDNDQGHDRRGDGRRGHDDD